MEENKTTLPSTLQYAQRVAIPLAIWWIASFACQMQAATMPALGFLTYGLGVFSLCSLAKDVAVFRTLKHPVGWARQLWFALLACLFCTLITTLAQHLYFRFLDGGAFLSNVLKSMEQPEFIEAWQNMQPGVTIDEMKTQLFNVTLSEMTITLLWCNILLSLIFAPVATLLSRLVRITIKIK